MSEYSTFYDGEWTQVYDLNKCIRAIQCRNADNEKRIECLEEENRKLKEEYSKDKEIQKMQERLNKMQRDYWRGFPITEAEEKAIEEWKKKHCCCSGGRYSYHFVPTELGTSGVIRCHCGAEFEFQEIR